MRPILLALAVLLLLPMGSDARRGKRVVVVEDYTSAAWDGVVEAMVGEFNAVMPNGGPHLVYQREEPADCYDLSLSRTKRVVKVCSFWQEGRQQGSSPHRRNIWVNDWFATHWWYGRFNRVTICHEMMHILAQQPDYYSKPSYTGDRFDATGYPYPDTSCLWGGLDRPGEKDVALLRKAYRRHHR